MLSSLYLYPLYVFLSIVLWEHFGKKVTTTFLPSVFFTFIADICQTFFSFLGRCAAQLSSLLTYIELGDFWNSVCDVLRPLTDIFFSFCYFFDGYKQTALKYARSLLIPVGSVLTILGLVKLTYHFEFNIVISNMLETYWPVVRTYMPEQSTLFYFTFGLVLLKLIFVAQLDRLVSESAFELSKLCTEISWYWWNCCRDKNDTEPETSSFVGPKQDNNKPNLRPRH
jgi:hypothetical protein